MNTVQNISSGTRAVSKNLKFDPKILLGWLSEHVDGVQGPIEVSEFKGGQSNPTFKLVTPGRTLVLRRKPYGPLVKSAHAVDREFHIISALYPTGYPVPQPLAFCKDESIIGSQFYVMGFVEGRILWDGTLPGMSPGERRSIYFEKINKIAALHQFDIAEVGLEEFGKRSSYLERQLARWTAQYDEARSKEISAMNRLVEWLPTSIPPSSQTTIVHGDFRLENLVLDPVEPQIRAVLDWELSTLGDPLADFTFFLLNWIIERDETSPSGLRQLNFEVHGIPTLDESVSEYCELTNRDKIPNINWYLSFNLFRLASICQGIVDRVKLGNASGPYAELTEKRVPRLAELSWSFAQRSGA